MAAGKKIAGLNQRTAIIVFVLVAVGVFLYLRSRASKSAAAQLSTASVPSGTGAYPTPQPDATGGGQASAGSADTLSQLLAAFSQHPPYYSYVGGTTITDTTSTYSPTSSLVYSPTQTYSPTDIFSPTSSYSYTGYGTAPAAPTGYTNYVTPPSYSALPPDQFFGTLEGASALGNTVGYLSPITGQFTQQIGAIPPTGSVAYA